MQMYYLEFENTVNDSFAINDGETYTGSIYFINTGFGVLELSQFQNDNKEIFEDHQFYNISIEEYLDGFDSYSMVRI